MHLDNVSVENSGTSGIVMRGSQRNTMKNCNVSHSKESGLYVREGALMTVSGNGTTIHHNCTIGYSHYFGLHTKLEGGKNTKISSDIHLASPLTIETISKNNGGGGNHGGKGRIKTI